MGGSHPYVGQEIEGFRILRELGRGGMGVVMLAEDAKGRQAAVKLLPKEVSGDLGYISRFEREAKVLQSLDHPNILKVFGTGRTPEGAYYILMEFVDGKSLGDTLKALGKVRADQAIAIAVKVADGLESAHRQGILHRDVKPDNILMSRSGDVKISDFGLAKDSTDNVKLTLTGQVIGTPSFMSPEQGMGEKVDERTDLYSLGVTLYTMLSGRKPFTGDTPMDVVMKHIRDPVPDLRKAAPSLPAGLYDLIHALLAKKPAARPRTAAEVAQTLRDVADRSGWDLSQPPTVLEPRIEATLDDVPGVRNVVGRVLREDETRATQTAPPAPARERVEEGELPGSTSDPRVGSVIGGKYLVRSLLGEGGMGSVYLVRHKDLEVDYALKLLRPEIGANAAFRERFLREAKVTTSFVHKNAIQIRDFGLDGDLLYMTMDYSRGKDLQTLLAERGPFPEKQAASVAHQALQALREAHAAGLIHRDLKPANIMIEERGADLSVRLLDFGVAKCVAEAGAAAGPQGMGLTRTGTLVGTVQYMSPEQAAGGAIDARSDLYAMAAILYETLSGAPPIAAENPQQMIYRLAVETPVPLGKRVKGVSRPLERLVMKNLEKEPRRRSASAAEFLGELESFERFLQSGVLARRAGRGWLWGAAAGGLLALAAAAALLLLDPFGWRAAPSPGPGGTGTGGGTGPGKEGPSGSKAGRAEEARALLLAGEAALERKDFASALASFESARRLQDSSGAAERIKAASFGLAMAAGEKALEARDWAAAVRHLDDARRAAPSVEDHLRAREMKDRAEEAIRGAGKAFADAEAFDKAGDWLKALPLYEACGRDDPKGPRAQVCRDRAADLSGRLAGFRGLVVRSTPPGATVLVDGAEAGKTPLLVADPARGARRVLLMLEGHKTLERTVDYAGARTEVAETLEPDLVLNLQVLGDRALLVSFRGVSYGNPPATVPRVPAGKAVIRVAAPDGAAYDLECVCEAGRTNVVNVDFDSLVREETAAFEALKAGKSLAECKGLFARFLERWPAGRRAEEVRRWEARLAAEADLWASAGEGGEEARLEAVRLYLKRYQDAAFPGGWFLAEAREALAGMEGRREDRAFESIGAKGTLAARIRACDAFLDEFPSGRRREEVRRLLADLKDEETAIARFDREARWGDRHRAGKDYLRRFPAGFDAARIREALEAMLQEENAFLERFRALKDPAETARAAREYAERFPGGELEAEMARTAASAEEEGKALERCATEQGCRDYLARFPQGARRKDVEERLGRFGWGAEEAGGVPQPAAVGGGLRRGERPGEYVSARDEAVMVFVPGGVFPLGTGDYFAEDEERPRVYVYAGSFFLDRDEVTNARYARFLEWGKTAADPAEFDHPLQRLAHPGNKDHTPSCWTDPNRNGPEQPVVGVDWFDAWAYARWAGKTLPTEAQWEVAASCDPRSKAKRKYPWGDRDPSTTLAVFDKDRPEDVGRWPLGASPYGAQDMAGNVAEWCLDAWDGERWEAMARAAKREKREWTAFLPLAFAESPEGGNPLELKFAPAKARWAVRGGAYDDDEDGIRTVVRRGESARSPRIGFRCALAPK
jgi:serine/threonine protein kinase/formylglycine-generating enzyme required for sulfatase activity